LSTQHPRMCGVLQAVGQRLIEPNGRVCSKAPQAAPQVWALATMHVGL